MLAGDPLPGRLAGFTDTKRRDEVGGVLDEPDYDGKTGGKALPGSRVRRDLEGAHLVFHVQNRFSAEPLLWGKDTGRFIITISPVRASLTCLCKALIDFSWSFFITILL